jgi:hypothetical protein
MIKYQIPSTKLQINSKLQLPNNQTILVSDIGVLVIGAYLAFACLPARQGIWGLGFFI